MNTKIIILFFTIVTTIFTWNFSSNKPPQKDKKKIKRERTITPLEDKEPKGKTILGVKVDSLKNKIITENGVVDSLKFDPYVKFKVYKKNAHASYYAQKFNGKRTASGAIFSNNKYTAAHKKLPFGTKVKVTNETNGKSVIIEVTDRGPFTKAREIDLSKKAFMELVDNKNSGVVIVKLEVENK